MAAPAPVDYGSLLAAVKAAQAPLDTRAVLQEAHAQALAATGAVTAGLQAQQQALQAQAGQEAHDISAAGDAAANTLQGMNLGGRLAAAYQQAGKDQAGIASGFSGQLRSTVGGEAAQASKALAALGAPGGVKTDTGAAGNAVYALGGAIPANELTAQAPLAVQNAQGAVKEAAGLGTNAAIGARGAGLRAAQRLTPQIVAAESRLPGLESTYAGRLLSQADKQRQNAIADAYKAVGLAQTGQKDAAQQAYQQGELAAAKSRNDVTRAHDAALERIGQQNANTNATRANDTATYQQGELGVARQNASTRATAVDNAATKYNNSLGKADAGVSKGLGVLSTADGKPILRGGKVIPFTSTAAGARPGTPKAPTADQVAKLVQAWHDGKVVTERVQQTDANGKVVTAQTGANIGAVLYRPQPAAVGKLSYMQAYKRLRAMKVADVEARQYLDSAYARGDGGRAWVTNEQQTALTRAGLPARASMVNGHAVLKPAQVAALKKANRLPAGQLTAEGALVIAPGY